MAAPSEQTPLLGSGVVDEENPSPQPLVEGARPRRRRQPKLSPTTKTAPYGLVALFIFIFTIFLVITFLPRTNTEEDHEIIISPGELTRNIFTHLRAFYFIAQTYDRGNSTLAHHDAYHDSAFYDENYAPSLHHSASRSITSGYNASAQYIITLLKANTNCDIELQYFKVPIWEKNRESELNVTFLDGDEGKRNNKDPHTVKYQGGLDFWSMRYGGQAAELRNQKVVSIPDPCENKDWKSVKGNIALIQEGNPCDFWDIAYKAEKEGATAVIFYNLPSRKKLLFNRVRIVNWKEGDPLMTIPVLAASYSLGQLLLFSEHARIDLQTFTEIKVVDTYNVICTLNQRGDKNNTIVLGAHLDSVPAGPGLVDNASGSSTLLEILLALERAHFDPRNRLVFAWWGAEEIGLLGSRHFVREAIRTGEKDNIAMNLNFDMLGSPNYVPFIHRGKDAPLDVRNASLKIQSVFENFFKSTKRSYELIDMLAGSDFLPFIQHGIPSGGILTGAGGIKSEDQRHIFGGLANTAFDPCYHQSCDTLENINEDAIKKISQAALYAITKLARKNKLREYLG